MKLTPLLFEKMMTNYLRPTLLEAGFAERKKCWFYRLPDKDVVWRVAAGLTMDRATDSGLLYVALCVGFVKVENLLKPFEPAYANGGKYPCSMATDLGHVVPPYQYKEWLVLGSSNADELGMEIGALLREGIRFYFGTFGSLEQAMKAWERGEVFNLGRRSIFYLAAAYAVSGNVTHALWLAEKFAEEEQASIKSTERDRQEALHFVQFIRNSVTH
jgi:hypothetical protein